jgi:hypothetical protein
VAYFIFNSFQLIQMRFQIYHLPKFFAPEELQLFEDFLDHDIEGNYYVVKGDGQVLACGGIFFRWKLHFMRKMASKLSILYSIS